VTTNQAERSSTAPQGNATRTSHEYVTTQNPPSPDAANTVKSGEAEQFVEIVADVLEVGTDLVTDTAGPDTVPAWTSLRHLQLVVTLEEAYQVSFSYQEVRNVRTVGQLRDVLRAKGTPL
jgi:acyl carrier protein